MKKFIPDNIKQNQFRATKPGQAANGTERRSRVSQSDVPAFALEEAIRIPLAISENYACHPVKPLDLAAALGLSPSSSGFRMLCGASIAYGLTDGGYNAPEISITPLARRILHPTYEGEDILARRESFLKSRVPREFLTRYNGNKLPREDIAVNVLVELGVPRDSAKRTFDLILQSGKYLGLFTDIKGQLYVNLKNDSSLQPSANQSPSVSLSSDSPNLEVAVSPLPQTSLSPPQSKQSSNRRVFISHGRNRTFVDGLKDLLAFGELEPVVSVEMESVSQPVPDKVMNDMRSCSAAIIHVDSEKRMITQEGEQVAVLNPNVLIEIGAAIALYGRRFVLLVRDGTSLPSNLQGLYEVRYEGEKLDGEVTIRLLKAIRDIKNHPLPEVAPGK